MQTSVTHWSKWKKMWLHALAGRSINNFFNTEWALISKNNKNLQIRDCSGIRKYWDVATGFLGDVIIALNSYQSRSISMFLFFE